MSEASEHNENITGSETNPEELNELMEKPREELAWEVLALRRKLAETTELAEKDPLTGLYNRRGFFKEAGRVHEIAQRTETPYALAIIDLDNFKEVNDKYGHPTGDKALAMVGKAINETIKESLRRTDFGGRYGGDEFIIMLPAAKDEVAESLRARIEAEMQEKISEVKESDPDFPEISYTIGFAFWKGEKTLEEVIKKADNIMYHTKELRKTGVLEINNQKEPAPTI